MLELRNNFIEELYEKIKLLDSVYKYGDLDTLDLKRLAIYTRNDENMLQELCCKDFIEYNNCKYTNMSVYKNDRKSANSSSSIINKLIKDIENKKIDTILCLSFDRITRNTIQAINFLELLNKNNVKLLLTRW